MKLVKGGLDEKIGGEKFFLFNIRYRLDFVR
jgi:hypothetical protein